MALLKLILGKRKFLSTFVTCIHVQMALPQKTFKMFFLQCEIKLLLAGAAIPLLNSYK